MNKKYKIVMAVTLATTSIAYSIGSLFAQSEEMINENTLIDVEEIKEENIEIEVLESKEDVQSVEKDVEDVVLNEVNFPDSYFRLHISVNYDTNKDGVLSRAERDRVTDRFLHTLSNERKKEITSVKGIEHFTKIRYLWGSYLGVTSIDLSKNTELESINLNSSKITSLDVSKNTALTSLGCSHTGITELDVSKNTALETLNITNTYIAGLDLSKNTALTTLSVYSSRLAWLHVGDNVNLSISTSNIESEHISFPVIGAIDRTFNIQEVFPGIDLNRITSISGAALDKTTGIVSEYEKGTYIRYTYDCGTDKNGTHILNVRLAFQKIKDPSTIMIDDDLNKVYDGTAVIEPINITKTGSNGAVSFEWYTSDGILLSSAPTNAGSYKVKAILAADGNYGSAEVEKAFEITKASSTIAINDNLNKIYDGTAVIEPNITKTGSSGAVSFEWYAADGTKLQTAPTDAGSYKVKAILAEDGNYGSAEVERSFEITKASSSIIVNDDLNKVYDGVAVVDPINIAKIGSTGAVTFEWYTAEGTKLQTAPTDAGSYEVKAILAGDTNHMGAEVGKEFTITKANSTITINDNLDKEYDGRAVLNPTNVSTTGSTGTVSFEWYTISGVKLIDAPINGGSYKVKAILAGDVNYVGAEVEETFEITKAMNQWKQELDIQGWVYGETPNNPSVEAQFGTVEYTYSITADGVYTTAIPTNAGTYWVKASVIDTDSYTGLEAKKAFTIAKASSMTTIDSDLNKEYDGQPVVEPQVTVIGSTGAITYEWYKKEESITKAVTWTKLATAPSEVGNYKVVVTVAGDGNYEAVTVEKEFSISEQVIVVPTPGLGGIIINPDGTEGPVVNPDDKVESNGPAITNPDGSITFPNGGTITKPDGSVVIIQSGATLKPNEESTTIPGQSVTGVQTGDGTQVGLWTMLVGLSTGMMVFFRRKNRKEV